MLQKQETAAVGASRPLTVVTFNVRQNRVDDGPNSWQRRQAFVADLLRDLDPDILGVQEPFADQVDAIAAALPGYRLVGVGREDGVRAGEWSAIFIREARFAVAEEGNFWFSETPDVPGSRSWDASQHTRLCTWALLKDRAAAGGRPLLVLNSHWDHEGAVARAWSAALIARFLAARPEGIPAVVMGDFNCTPESAPIRYLTGRGALGLSEAESVPASPELRDAWIAANGDVPDDGTFHGFQGGTNGGRIDYILITEGIAVESCGIDRRSRDGKYPSDHFPMKATLRMVP